MATIKDKKFLAKAAVYARTEFGMRSISHVVAGELPKYVKGEAWMKSFIDRVVFRPDDMTEILSYYMVNYGKPVPNALKKGLAKAFDKFNEYQLAKYQSRDKDISLVDVVNMVHPKPTEKNAEALKKLIADTLRSSGTWEADLSKAGQKAETEEEKKDLKADVWASLLKEKKLGYFALLRNLRNIMEQAPEVLDLALAQLVDEKAIKKSLVLPFRYLTAIDQFNEVYDEKARKIEVALNKALDLAVSNVPAFEGKTLVAVDVSGSMMGRTSEIAGLFAAVIAKANNADILVFNETARYKNYNPADSTLTIAKAIRASDGGTNYHAPFAVADKAYDRIIILSDAQGWMEYNAPTADLAAYRAKYKVHTKIYSMDLQGYGTMQFPEKDVFCLAGFSEKIFDVMKLLEQDKNALISKIQAVVI